LSLLLLLLGCRTLLLLLLLFLGEALVTPLLPLLVALVLGEPLQLLLLLTLKLSVCLLEALLLLDQALHVASAGVGCEFGCDKTEVLDVNDLVLSVMPYQEDVGVELLLDAARQFGPAGGDAEGFGLVAASMTHQHDVALAINNP